LFDNSPLAICVNTTEGKILGVNRALSAMTGYSEDELLHSDVRMLYMSPDQRAQALQQIGPEGSLSNYGMQLRRRDGSLYYVNLNISRLELAGQQVLLGIADDVTEEVEAHQALTTLHHISHDLTSIADLQTLLDHALQHLHTVVDFQRAALMLVEDGEESLTVYAYTSPTLPPVFTIHHIPISSWPFLQTALTGRDRIYVPDMQASEAIQTDLDGMQTKQWAAALKASRSWLGLPLRAGERTIGLLNILHDAANHYEANDIELARTFANQLAVAIDNIHLNEQTGRAAAADERSRIARELHDSLTQTLFTASVLAEATPRIWIKDQGIARQNMEKLGVLIRGALAEMRSLLLELRSDAQPDQTLDQLLNTLAEATRARSNMAVSISIEVERELPADVTMTLYRIAQEALNNVIKHAEATVVDITLLDQPDRVTLRIRDDGRGFDPQVIPAGHMGISIMAERAQKIGADMQIQSQPNRGAEVSVTWPGSPARSDRRDKS